jgi:hypothetical protein
LRLAETGVIGFVQGESKECEVVAAMLALAESRADDHRGDRILLEHPARGDVGDRDAVLDGNGLCRREDPLEHPPAADRVDEALVLRLAPVGNVGRLRSIDPPIAEEAAGQHAVGQELHAGLTADLRHAPGRPTVEQRKRHLVRDDGNAVFDEQAEMIGVEVRHAEARDATLAAQPVELEHGVEVPGMPVLPPVELQQVDARKPEPLETLADSFANNFLRHRPGKWAPLGERPGLAASGLREIPADEELGAAVVVGHVERVESRVGVLLEGPAGGIRIEWLAVALHVGDLPETSEHARHLEAGPELDARRAKGSVGHGGERVTSSDSHGFRGRDHCAGFHRFPNRQGPLAARGTARRALRARGGHR